MRTIAIVMTLAALACLGCDPEANAPPQIGIDISPVYVGARSTDPDVTPMHFDLQLYNTGGDVLVINSATWRGDQNCAFTFEGPDRAELGADESAFMRGWYHPSVVAIDQISLEVRSNAENFALFEVAVCGRGVEPGTFGVRPVTCVIPPAEQPDCPTM